METSVTSSAQEISDAIQIAATGPNGASRAFFNAQVQLQSLHTHQVITRCFSEASEAVYALSAILPALTTSENVMAVQTELFNRIDGMEKDIASEIARVTKMIEGVGIDLNQLSYTAAQTYSTQICSPRANQLLRVITQLDALIKLYDTLWLTETINEKTHTDNIHLWKRRVIKLMNHVRDVGFRAMNAAHRAKDKASKKEGDAEVPAAPVEATATQTKQPKPAKKAAGKASATTEETPVPAAA